MNSGEGRHGRGRWRLVVGVCAASVAASVVYAVQQAWHGGLGPADLVTVLGFPLAVASMVGMLAGLRKPPDGTDAALARQQAETLARLVAESEGRVLTQLLGRDTARINLHYGLVPNPVRPARAPAAGLAVADPATSLPDIAAFYRSTRPARLVITGAPGAGKTVLALQLLLALIANRDVADPVPVRVPLAHWDTDVPLREILVKRLVDTFNLPRAVADNLVKYELVLPVLDGLDEMDPPLPNGDPDPAAPRARAALDRLSAHQDSGVAAPLVVACRTAHYNALATADLLLDAAHIAIAPIGSTPAVTYLSIRARDLPRWQTLLDYLIAHPGSVHTVLLSTPWRLCLTATVYHRTGDPAELLTHTDADDLDNHLLARYITAATAAASDTNPRSYTPQQIHHWLHQLAAHLAPTPQAPTRTDIALDRLWPMAGPRRVRASSALLATLILLLPLPFTWRSSPFPTTEFALVVAAGALLFGSIFGQSKKPAIRLDLHRLTTPAVRHRLLLGLAVGATLGLAAGKAAGVTAGVALGLAAVLAIGVAYAWTSDQSSAAKPGTVIRKDAQQGLLTGLTAGLMIGLTGVVQFGLQYGLAGGLSVGLTAGLMVGLAGGLSCSSWRYTVFLLCARRRVPFRLARFLDWGCDTGLMRYSGPAYQFRHRELQRWLAAHPDPVT